MSDHIAERDETETADGVWGTELTDKHFVITFSLLQASPVKTNEQEKLVTRLVLLNNFMFVLRNIKTDSVIMFGNVFRQSA